jgi:hypothetical protein
LRRRARDVGIHTTAVDYVENFYRPAPVKSWAVRFTNAWKRFTGFMRPMVREYFEAKGAAITY